MAQHPNWATKDPGYTIVSYWTATPSSSNPNAGFWTNTRDNSPNYVRDSGSRSYSVTPGFNSPSRSQLVKPLNYSATYETTFADSEQHQYETRLYTVSPPGNVPPYGVVYVYQDSSTITHNSFQLGFRVPTYNASSVADRATKKLLEVLKDQKVNVAQAFAEREETVKTVTQSAKTIASVLTNLHKGNFSGAAKALGISPPKRGQRRFNKAFANDSANAVGNGWLALQYGWRPLLQDTYGAAETLAQASLGPENKNSVYSKSHGQSRFPLALSQRVVNSNPGWTGYDSTVFSCNGFYLSRIGVRYSRASAPVSSLAKLGILNPLQLAWELVPYSFVVDWFLPIGDWLGGLDASAGLAFESGYRTNLLKYEATSIRSQSIKKDSSSAVSNFTAQESKRFVQISRVTLSSFPSAPAPSFKNPLSFSHLASAMALLKQFKR